jgi:hypothetical protein
VVKREKEDKHEEYFGGRVGAEFVILHAVLHHMRLLAGW